MKKATRKLVMVAVLGIISGTALFADGPQYPYRRFIEFGFDAGIGFANNFIGVGDILTQQIVINLDEIGSKIKAGGVSLDFDPSANVFFNVNVSKKWGFGLFSSVSGSLNLNLPKSMFTLLSEGNRNQHSQDGDISLFGGIFADVGFDAHAKFLNEKLRISLKPAMFVPIVYVPKSSISYGLQANDSFKVTASGEVGVYTPIPLGGEAQADYASMFNNSGFDLTVSGEFSLFSFLDIGASLTHFPLVSAVLENRRLMKIDRDIIDGSGILTGDDIDIDMPSSDDMTDDTTNPINVRRPMRFDVFARFKPLKRNLIMLIPQVGITMFTPEDKTRFNATVEFQLNTPVFLLSASTGYDELLWRHRLGIGINLRIIEFDVGVDLRSQDFVQSFKLNGAGVSVGLKMGF